MPLATGTRPFGRVKRRVPEVAVEGAGPGFQCGGSQSGNNGRGDDRLRDDDGNRRVNQSQLPKRTAAPEHHRNDQTDDNRRQRHACIDDAQNKGTSAKIPQCKPCAKRQTDQQADDRRNSGDLKREESDLKISELNSMMFNSMNHPCVFPPRVTRSAEMRRRQELDKVSAMLRFVQGQDRSPVAWFV